MLGMPSGDNLYAKDLIEVLERKHEAKSYKRIVFYLEACESGSMFDGLLTENKNIYMAFPLCRAPGSCNRMCLLYHR